MTQIDVYRLDFHSGLHVGVTGVDLEESAITLPSDTLFAALVDAARRTGVDPQTFVAPFPKWHSAGVVPESGEVPFQLTSTFPFAGGVLFFPMPVPRQRLFSQAVLKARRKEINRIRFVSEMIFRHILTGKCLDGHLFPEAGERPTDGVALQNGEVWMTVAELEGLPSGMQLSREQRHALHYQRLFAHTRMPRVTVERVSMSSDIYHTGRLSFAPDCGLWFGVAWYDPDSSLGNTTVGEVVHQTLELLADDGLGGERSAGYGAFTFTRDTRPLNLPDAIPGKPGLLLSRYHPAPGEVPEALQAASAAYDLVPVGGWLRSWDGAAQRRRRLWMVKPGSIVGTTKAPQGDLVDVRPTFDNPKGDLPHPVWRYGLALAAGLKEVHDDA